MDEIEGRAGEKPNVLVFSSKSLCLPHDEVWQILALLPNLLSISIEVMWGVVTFDVGMLIGVYSAAQVTKEVIEALVIRPIFLFAAQMPLSKQSGAVSALLETLRQGDFFWRQARNGVGPNWGRRGNSCTKPPLLHAEDIAR